MHFIEELRATNAAITQPVNHLSAAGQPTARATGSATGDGAKLGAGKWESPSEISNEGNCHQARTRSGVDGQLLLLCQDRLLLRLCCEHAAALGRPPTDACNTHSLTLLAQCSCGHHGHCRGLRSLARRQASSRIARMSSRLKEGPHRSPRSRVNLEDKSPGTWEGLGDAAGAGQAAASTSWQRLQAELLGPSGRRAGVGVTEQQLPAGGLELLEVAAAGEVQRGGSGNRAH